MNLRPPNATVSEEERQQVYNEDLPGLSVSELYAEMFRTGRIVARYPRRFIWRGLTPITVRRWGDERIEACRALLGGRPAQRRQGPVRAWVH